ncbi:MAG: SGNH/GDSL hydrolase family protein [Planctomycetota bacterium]|nr:SGNH/GDSL hydrolase family protein [Planctomycetota bacterium]MDA1165815.1 SGNH/GDSL hydrolase family protein [Planctomycetota bacterium]
MNMSTRWNSILFVGAVSGGLLLMSPCLTVFGADDDKPNFDKWEPSIQKFEEQDKDHPQPLKANLFVGSSSIRMWQLDKSFPDSNTINRGFGGSEIADSIHFAERIILKHQPKVVLLYAGDNDIAHGKSAERVTEDFQKFVAVVRKRLPDTEIAFIAIKPSIKRWNLASKILEANNAIAVICEKDAKLTYVDIVKPMLGADGKPRPELFLKDGLHLNEQGYQLWASIVRPLLQ